jgi:hypothetical protein
MKTKSLVLAIATLALMTTSCKEKAIEMAENPLLSEWNTPFGVPPFDQIEVAHYEPAFKAAMALHEEEIEAIVNNSEKPTFENTILALDNAGELLGRVSNTFFLVASADTNDEMQSLVSSWLGDELHNLVSTNFTTYGFFGLSALGSNPDMENRIPKFRPFRVADPFLWLLALNGIIPMKKK